MAWERTVGMGITLMEMYNNEYKWQNTMDYKFIIRGILGNIHRHVHGIYLVNPELMGSISGKMRIFVLMVKIVG